MPGTPDLIAAYEALVDARLGYVEADEFYAGDVGEVYASERVRRLLVKARADQVEEFNYAHIPVDTIANRLEIVSVTAVQEKGDGHGKRTAAAPAEDAPTKAAPDGAAPRAGETAAGGKGRDVQAAVDDLWKRNQLDAESNGLHQKASRNGDCYLIVWPDSDEDGKVTAVDMRVNSALTTRVIYDEEDPLEVAYAIKSWTYDQPTPVGPVQYTRANLYYDDRIERWISQPNAKGKELCNAKAWLPYSAEEEDGKGSVIRHSYGRVPVFHFRNDRPYGKPEHLYAYGPQQMLNKLVTALATAVDYQMFPQRVALMDPTSDQPMGNFLDPTHPEDDDDPEGELNHSQLSADPAAVWKLWGAKSIQQLDPANPDTFLKPFDRFVQAMAELTETPLYRFGSAFAQTPSGAALRAADAPTVNKAENRQSAYDAVWEDAFEFALMLLGFTDVKVSVAWKPAEQATDFEAWSVVQAKIAAGVPQRQALIETGYTEDQIDEWLGGEAAVQAKLTRKVDLLTSIAGALQQLGAAVTMNVLSEKQMQTLVSDLLGDTETNDEPATAAA